MSLVLPTDLLYCVFSYIPVPQLPQHGNNKTLVNLFRYLLLIRGLTPQQIDRAYKPNKRLSPYQAFSKVLTYYGELRENQHLYVNWYYCLIRAIQVKDWDLINYYLQRGHGTSHTVPYNFIFYLAICTKDREIVALVRAFFEPYISTIYNSNEVPESLPLNNTWDYGLRITPKPVFNIDLSLALKNMNLADIMHHINNGAEFPEKLLVFPEIPLDVITPDFIAYVSEIIAFLEQQVVPSEGRDIYLLLCRILTNSIETVPEFLQLSPELRQLACTFSVSVCNVLAVEKLQLNFCASYVYYSQVLYHPKFFVRYQNPRVVESIWTYSDPLIAYNFVLPVGPIEELRPGNKVYDLETLEYAVKHHIDVLITPATKMIEPEIKRFLKENALSLPLGKVQNPSTQNEIAKSMKKYLQ